MTQPRDAGLGQKRRFQRRVDQVGDQRRRRQPRQVDIERRFADHALVGAVDEQGTSGHRGIAVRPIDGADRRAELCRNRLRLLGRAVGDPDLPRAILQQRHNHGPCGSAGAEHQDRPVVRAPAGHGVAQALDKSVAVIVEAAQRAVGFDDDGVDGADALARFR